MGCVEVNRRDQIQVAESAPIKNFDIVLSKGSTINSDLVQNSVEIMVCTSWPTTNSKVLALQIYHRRGSIAFRDLSTI